MCMSGDSEALTSEDDSLMTLLARVLLLEQLIISERVCAHLPYLLAQVTAQLVLRSVLSLSRLWPPRQVA